MSLMSIIKKRELEPLRKTPKTEKIPIFGSRDREVRKGIVRKRHENPKKIIITAKDRKINKEAFKVNW